VETPTTRRRAIPWLRRPVRREGAERYLLITLVSFAGTVILTRWFLTVTGFPQVGGGDLHIAHALWGGAALFAAALLPILLAGRFVYMLSAFIGGVGIGLFIDEVGKFITADNDYFYPAAAPIIYATFLLAVLVWLRVRSPGDPDPRSQLLTALELFEESVEGDLQREERDELRERLAAAAANAPAPEQRRLAADLLAFVDAEEITLAPDPVDRIDELRRRWRERSAAWLGGRGLRIVVVALLIVMGVVQLLRLGGIGSDVRLATALDGSISAFTLLQVGHLVVEAVSGGLLVAGGALIAIAGRHRLGWTLAYFGLLVALTLADLISFYLRQFDSIEAALGHLVLLAAVIVYRDELRTEIEGVPARDTGP
jgi:hypothetical protein